MSSQQLSTQIIDDLIDSLFAPQLTYMQRKLLKLR